MHAVAIVPSCTECLTLYEHSKSNETTYTYTAMLSIEFWFIRLPFYVDSLNNIPTKDKGKIFKLS